MLIEAKSRETQAAKTDGKGPFQFSGSEKKSRLPVWVAMAITAVFAYFKEFSSGTAGDKVLHDEHAVGNRPHDVDGAAPKDNDLAAEPTPARTPAPHPHGHPQPSQWQSEFILSDEAPLTLMNPARSMQGFRSFAPHVLETAASNDNGFELRGMDFGLDAPGTGPSAARARTVVASGPAPHAATPTAPVTPGATPPAVPPPAKSNRAPTVTGPVRLNDVIAGQAMLLALGDLLLGAHDLDGDALQVTNLAASNGEIVKVDDGWSYHANAGAETVATLSYDISDGKAVIHQTADFKVLSEVHTLTPGDDVAVGTPKADQIDAGDGNDVIDAGAGADTVFGGAGDDHIQGGDGDDVLMGQAGNDVIFGGAGNDIISGGAGNDRLFGDAGNDTISGDDGDDYLSGGDGNDLLLGGNGNDVIDGGRGNDHMDGGDGVDTLDYSASATAVTVDLRSGIASGDSVGQDTIAAFECIIGSSSDDLFKVGEDDISIFGGAGDDTYEVATGAGHLQINDFLVGDRIHVGDYEVMDRPISTAQPQFDDIYSDVGTDNGLPIKAQSDVYEGLDVTVLEARAEGSDSYDIYISLIGHHDLVYVLHAIA